MPTHQIVLGGGCFWCLEAFLQQFKGITSAEPGYAGGTTQNPTYEQVCAGIGHHAEVVRVTYDPSALNLSTLLEVFWAIHDPTTKDRQGHDVGPQYRSAVYYYEEKDLPIIKESLTKAQANWPDPIVTEIKPLSTFYEAETYHKNYFADNPEKAYCQVVINPKLRAIRSRFEALMD